MNRNILARGSIHAAIAAAAVLMIGASALAQQTEGVTVEAARQAKIVGRSSSGVPIEQITLTRKVSYTDLDLKTPAGSDALTQRVKDVAKEACEELDKLYPLTQKTAPDCTKQAIDSAMEQVHAAIAAATKKQ
jgi:UrcA family protein